MFQGNLIALGPLVPNDFVPLFRWTNDAQAARLNAAFRPVDWVTHKTWCETVGRDPSRVIFAIRPKGVEGIIGFVEITAINTVHHSAQIGIRIGEEKDRNQGYGREALQLAQYYCFNHLNLNRVWLSTFRHNARAIRAFQAAGFKKEGVLRRAEFIDGDWVDVVLMAALNPRERRRSRRPAATAERPPIPDRAAATPQARQA